MLQSKCKTRVCSLQYRRFNARSSALSTKLRVSFVDVSVCGKEVEVEDDEVDFRGRDEAVAKRDFLLLRTQDPALDKSRGLLCFIHPPRGDTGNESA